MLWQYVGRANTKGGLQWLKYLLSSPLQIICNPIFSGYPLKCNVYIYIFLTYQILKTSSLWMINQVPQNLFFFLRFIYNSWETQRERQRHRGRSRLPTGSLMQDSIPEPKDHDLAQGRCSTTESPRCPPRNILIIFSPSRIDIIVLRNFIFLINSVLESF